MTMTVALPDVSRPLSTEAAAEAFAAILDGSVPDEAIRSFLIALSERGEAVEEVAAAAREMRTRMVTIAAPAGAIDVCGTGGDGSHSLNVSTAVAIVVAACGIPVAKHGNRAASSRAGASSEERRVGKECVSTGR